jgi:hypothetical protein
MTYAAIKMLSHRAADGSRRMLTTAEIWITQNAATVTMKFQPYSKTKNPRMEFACQDNRLRNASTATAFLNIRR